MRWVLEYLGGRASHWLLAPYLIHWLVALGTRISGFNCISMLVQFGYLCFVTSFNVEAAKTMSDMQSCYEDKFFFIVSKCSDADGCTFSCSSRFSHTVLMMKTLKGTITV